MLSLYVGAISYLPFLNFGSSASVFKGFLDAAQSVSLPSPLQFGNKTYTTAYVSTCNVLIIWHTWFNIQINTHGQISLGHSYVDWTPETFPISIKLIAPYWTDIDTRQQGQINYIIVTKQSNDSVGSIALINNFLASNVSVTFNADWILMAQWMKVCSTCDSTCATVCS